MVMPVLHKYSTRAQTPNGGPRTRHDARFLIVLFKFRSQKKSVSLDDHIRSGAPQCALTRSCICAPQYITPRFGHCSGEIISEIGVIAPSVALL